MKYFVRQLYVVTGAWTAYFLNGVCLGCYTVSLPQMKRENATISSEVASWLPATHTYVAIPWMFILSYLCVFIGRKRSHLIVCSLGLVGFIINYCSTNVTHILIAEAFLGPMGAAILTTSILITTEYSSSKYRGPFLIVKSASFFWGILISNAMGTFYHWKNIPLFGIVCCVFLLVNVIIWPESPYWLAAQSRFEECSKAHRWLKGHSEESEKELAKLITYEQNHLLRRNSNQRRLRKKLKTMTRRQFLKPMFLSSLLSLLYATSGKLACAVYAIDILKKLTNSESAAYNGMLILDAATVCSMYISSFINRFFKRRFMLFTTSFLGFLFLFLTSGFLYLVSLSVLSDNAYVVLVLLSGYSIFICCGPMVLTTSIIGEIYPLELRTVSTCIVGVMFKLFNGTVLKLTPLLMNTLSMHGTFLFFCIVSSLQLVILYFFLPETKDKTLQEISEEFKNNTLDQTPEIGRLMNTVS